MRVKKQKRHRRTVTFFKACFGFREPFKVLCDGTFVHHLVVNGILPADKALSNILSGSVKLFTTSCVVAELKRLGRSYSETLQAAQKLMIARCDHDRTKSAESCITEVIGQTNPEHFFVATQDTNIRKKFQEIPSVPLIFGLRNALFLEQPSAFQREFAKMSEEQRSHMTPSEQESLLKTTKKLSENEQNGLVSVETDGFITHHNLEKHARKNKHSANRLSVKDRPQFKRKKAKGPNPLSVKKKKKTKEAPNTSAVKGSNDGDRKTGKGRKRNRTRTKKSKIRAELVAID